MSTFQPIIIIGAARSGTNMLRDTLNQVPNFGTWDCDEINPIWRHGNLNHPHDQFEANMVTPKIKKLIRHEFEKIAKKTKSKFVIEKSCANTLRLPFINEIFPEAKYIYIYRDGRDTVASAKKRWKAKFDLNYTLKKLRYVPIVDIPYYGLSFGKARLKQLLSKNKQLDFWGVRLPEMQQLLKTNNLEQVCAFQWQQCNLRALDFFSTNSTKVIKIKYEEIVSAPVSHLKNVLSFLQAPQLSQQEMINISKNIRTTSIGKYKKELSTENIIRVEKIMASTLESLAYNTSFV